MNRPEFGCLAKDKVTGFTGIITGYCDYLTGCAQWLITPVMKADGTLAEPRWYDDGRVEVLDAVPVISYEAIAEGALTTGADIPAPIR